MYAYLNYPAPNIVAGSNLDEEKVNQLYAWIQGLQADYCRSFNLNGQHGLLRSLDGSSSLILDIAGDYLILSKYVGVTPGGSLIALLSDLQSPLKANLGNVDIKKKVEYDIVLNVLHNQRQAFGRQSEDLPLRPLNAMSRLEVTLTSSSVPENTNRDAVLVGRMHYEGDTWQLSEWIPPCFHIGGHPVAIKMLHVYKERARKMRIAIPKVLSRTNRYDNKAINELRAFGLAIGQFVAERENAYADLNEKSQVKNMVSYWLGLSSIMLYVMECFEDKQGFQQLLVVNMKHAIGGFYLEAFKQVIKFLSAYKYTPDTLTEVIAKIDELIRYVVPMFEALSERIIMDNDEHPHIPDPPRKTKVDVPYGNDSALF